MHIPRILSARYPGFSAIGPGASEPCRPTRRPVPAPAPVPAFGLAQLPLMHATLTGKMTGHCLEDQGYGAVQGDIRVQDLRVMGKL
jgi:hypothetical protein